MDANCVFCKIVAGEIPADKVYEDEHILAFKDRNPTASVHVLVVPKTHIKDLSGATTQEDILGKLQAALGNIAAQLGITSGYKVILNAGKYQEVPHLHYHLLNE